MIIRLPIGSEEDAFRYHRWYERPPGSILAGLEEKALLHFLSALPKGPLLEVGSGTGHFTSWFWELGFQAIGMDCSAPMLKVAHKTYPSIPFLQGSGEALPFLDRSFDVAAFITSLEFMVHPQVALREAARVARKAILLGLINRWGVYGLCRRLRRDVYFRLAHLYSISQVKSLLQDSLDRKFTISWRSASLSSRFGHAPSGWSAGGFIAARIDFLEK
jgi:SAM-dependent methyltransferase